jgi:hypothetical protein
MKYDALKQLALALPSVEESTSYGTPALKVKGKLMVRLREDGKTVVLRADWDRREASMTVHPDVFFITDHYRAHPWVLAHLSSLTAALAATMLDHAWRQVAPKTLLARAEGRTTMTTARAERITGTILSGHKEAAVEVPFDPAERWQVAARPIRKGRRGHAVCARLSGVAFDSVIVPRSKRFWLIVDKEPLAAAGVGVGDSVTIDIEPAAGSA